MKATYTVCKVLAGHVSPETAYLVNDYPYGFNLRCRIRYWVEFHAKKGARMFSQTSNPKREAAIKAEQDACNRFAGTNVGVVPCVWNKPKASTFSRFGGALFINEVGHVCWDGVNEYSSIEDMVAWFETFSRALPEDFRRLVFLPWLRAKLRHDEVRASGNVRFTFGDGTVSACEAELSAARRAELNALYAPPAAQVPA